MTALMWTLGGSYAAGLLWLGVVTWGRVRAEPADEYGCPDATHHGVDCPGDRCRYADRALDGPT